MSRSADHLRAARRYVLIGFLCIATILVGIGLWGATATISSALIVSGVVEVDQNRQPVEHPLGGVVDAVFVEDGDSVTAGDLLIRLDTSAAEAERGYAQEHLFELQARQDRLRASYNDFPEVVFSKALEAAASTDKTLARMLKDQRVFFATAHRARKDKARHTRQRQSQIATRILGANAQIAALAKQIGLMQIALDQQEALLSRGLTSSGPVLDLQREIASLEGRLGHFTAARAEAQEKHAELALELEKEWNLLREKTMAKSLELERAVREYRNEARRWRDEIAAAEIRAPVSGVVYGLAVQAPRTILTPNDPALFILPTGRPAVVKTRVSPSDIELVSVGQSVKLRLSALDQRTTPEIYGEVSHVSADTVTDEDSGARFFAMKVHLPATALEVLPDPQLLVHGMPVEIFIQTGDRTPLAYLIKPVADYFARAFRES